MPAPVRRRPAAELSRGRSRTLFFALLLVAAGALRAGPAVVVAAVALGLALWSIAVARGRGRSLSHSFVVGDWLLLGLTLALAGGGRSPLLAAVPLLVVCQLLPSDKAEWPFLLGPSLVVPIVLAIADPTLAGHRALTLGALAGLVLAGLGAAAIDATTGYYSRPRLAALVPAELAAAEAAHEPLALVCVRLDHYRDLRDFRGLEGSESVVRTVARRLKRTLGPDDLAFRLAPDLLAVTLRGRDTRTVRTWTQEAAHEVTGQLIDRHRQTLSFGCAAYPPLHDARTLLDEALAALAAPAATELVLAPAAVAADRELPLAVAT